MAFKWLVLAGSITGAYGYADAPRALDARFNGPSDCALSPDRSVLYVADYGNNAIRRVHLSGTFPVDTLCTVTAPRYVTVNPATGNLWVVDHVDGSHRISRITPGGAVTVVATEVGNWFENVLPDAAETYVRVKGFYSGSFYVRWQLYRVADGAWLGEAGGDGAYTGDTGQMWSVRHPDVWVYATDYPAGAALMRHEVYGAPVSFGTAQSPGWAMRKIVPGPDLDPPHETYLAVNQFGWLCTGSFDADPAALWMTATPTELQVLGLPRLPAAALERNLVTGDLYFPTTGGWTVADSAGISDDGVPRNCIVLATPADDLSYA